MNTKFDENIIKLSESNNCDDASKEYIKFGDHINTDCDHKVCPCGQHFPTLIYVNGYYNKLNGHTFWVGKKCEEKLK